MISFTLLSYCFAFFFPRRVPHSPLRFVPLFNGLFFRASFNLPLLLPRTPPSQACPCLFFSLSFHAPPKSVFRPPLSPLYFPLFLFFPLLNLPSPSDNTYTPFSHSYAPYYHFPPSNGSSLSKIFYDLTLVFYF